MDKLYFGESIIKLLVVVIFIACVVSGWHFSAQLIRENQSGLAISLERISNQIALPFKVARLSKQATTTELPVPVYGVNINQINDTWGAARAEGRRHEGVDIFADRGTPVFSSTRGYVTELNIGNRGGKNVMVVGPGGVYYYYAHLDRIAAGITPGQSVTADTVLGFVGNTGNASGTPPHLHFGIYPEMWDAINPFPQLTARWQ